MTRLPLHFMVDSAAAASRSACLRCHDSSAVLGGESCKKFRRNRLGRHRCAFSLVEVLLGIFILGIGVISIAALFPAGIVQQRESVDQVTGPIVANNALSIIRMKVQPSDFGTLDEFNVGLNNVSHEYPTIAGDWCWIRPALVLNNDGATTNFDETGSIDIFSHGGGSSIVTEFPGGMTGSAPNLVGIPYNLRKYGTFGPPHILITQEERAYPMRTQFGNANIAQPTPQYYWDCMFRRSGGRIQVAIFVYRVTYPGGQNVDYNEAFITPIDAPADEPRIPFKLPFINPQNASGQEINTDVTYLGPWDAGGLDAVPSTRDDNDLVYGNENPGYNPLMPRQAWQEPGQWLIDQNAYVHRVLSFTDGKDTADGHARVQLVRPPPEVPNISTNFVYGQQAGYFEFDNVVCGLWYIPIEIDVNGDGRTDLKLTPVYATVKDL
ncbi:MAG TPA: hypothetical protein VG711_10455 [Phycisphaerales bacterium]|nr:hypothetical protein [Phycisphaerales bacterium]